MDSQTQKILLEMLRDSGGEKPFNRRVMPTRLLAMMAELADMGLVECAGKDERAITYRLAAAPPVDHRP